MRAPRFRTLRGWATATALGLCLVSASPTARAQVSDEERTASEVLFREARRLMDEGDFANACPKLADSQRLDPGIGTLLNLGLCYKKLGRTASAWSTYREAADASRAAGQDKRQEVAQREADELEPLLSRLTVHVEPETSKAGAEILLDGVALPSGVWEVPMPVDPGEHVIEATAPGKVRWGQKFQVDQQKALTIQVPVLEAAPEPEAEPEPAPPPVTSPPPAPAPAPPPPEPPFVFTTQKQVAVAAGGVGVLGLIAGTLLSLSARSDMNASNSECSVKGVCTADGIEQRDRAAGKATWATLGFSLGAAGLAAGTVLWVIDRPASEQPPGSSPALEVGLVPARHEARSPWTLHVRGSF